MTGGLRERKKLETRAALERAAVELVVDRGAASVTVEDIAAAAGVSTRTFFNYFPAKEDAVLGETPEAMHRIREAVRTAPAEMATLEVLRRALRTEAARVEDDPELTTMRMAAVRADPELLARLVASTARDELSVVEAVAERLGVDPEVYPALVVGVSWAVFRVCLTRWALAGGSASLAELLDGPFDAIVTGLADPA